MYDPKNEPHEFVAESREEAVGKAVRFFGLDEDALAIGELPAGEVYGLAGRSVVVAVPKDRKPPQRSAGGGEARRERERDRGDRGGRERRDRGGRGRDRDRGRSRGERVERAPRETRELSDEPSVGTPRGTLGEAGEYLLGMIERLQIGPFEIGETEDAGLIVCDVKGEAARALAHGDGRAVDALQLLVNQAALRAGDDAKRVVLDVEGNSEAREQFLERLAERVVRRATEGGRAVALDPMNARERRIIHLAVREHPGMATMSVGEGRYRQVVVVPEGAPEYQDALEQTEAAKRGA